MRGIKDNRVSTIQLIMLYVLIALAVAMVLTTVLRGRISDMMISEMQSGMINVVEQDRFLLKEKFNSIYMLWNNVLCANVFLSKYI